MEAINLILEDNSIPETEKLKKINTLLDTKLEEKKENVNLDVIFNINTESIELKYIVLRKALTTANNVKGNIEYFINYFKKTFDNLENHKMLAKCLGFIFEIRQDQDQVQDILNQLGIDNVNKVLLSDIFSHKDSKGSELVFKPYLKCLAVDHQAMLFKKVFELSEIHQNVAVIYLMLENVDKNALTHDQSILQTEDLWLYLTNYLINSKEHEDTQTVILVLESCMRLTKRAKLELKFLSVDGDEDAWNAFFALTQVFTLPVKCELMKPSLQLLSFVSSLHYFWQHCIYKLLVKRVPIHLKCTVLVSILKQTVKDENLNIYFKLILSAINERKCDNEECPVFRELNNFSENTKVENVPIILDEILNITWNNELLWKIFGNVLVDSKKKLVNFGYFSRIVRHLDEHSWMCFPNREMGQISTFFYESENIEFWRQLRGSNIPFSTSDLPVSENFKNMVIPKLIELSSTNSDDLLEIQVYLGFLEGPETYIDVIKNYPVNIHVRLVIYRPFFTSTRCHLAASELDEEKTVNDFYEYLIKHLNEKTYIYYRDLMLSFLDLMDRIMSFSYPEKACSQFLKIILNPELYTKYQVCCTTEILRWVDYRFDVFGYPSNDYYNKIAQKWKNLILETEDQEMCKEGLYFVLNKGQLNTKEYNEIVKKLLEKHLCDDVAEEIYHSYLNNDLMNFALKRLNDVMEKDLNRYKKFSKLFCKAVVSGRYINSKQFTLENEEFNFCCSNSKNLHSAIYELDYVLFDDLDYKCQGKVTVTIEIYLNKQSNIKTKLYCLRVLLTIVSRYSARMPLSYSEYFKADVKWIMNRLKEKYALNLEDDFYKLRIVQGLFLLIPCVMRDFDNKFKHVVKRSKVNIYKKLRNSLKRIAVGILVKESDNRNNAARQICQHMYILLCQHDATFKEIVSIIEKVKEIPDLACSFMPVLYHVMPFCKLTKNEVEEIFASMFNLLVTSDHKLRIYAQIVLQHFYNMNKNGKFKNIIEKYTSRLEQIGLEIESNKNQITDILKTDYLFIKVLDPIRDHSLETVLEILPKLNQVDSAEWNDAMKHDLIWFSAIPQFTKDRDENETLKKSVEIFLKPEDDKYANYCAEDILEMFRMPSENREWLTI